MLTQNRYPDLLDWFKHFIGFDEASMEPIGEEGGDGPDNHQPWSEIDFSTCKRYGPIAIFTLSSDLSTIVPFLPMYVHLMLLY